MPGVLEWLVSSRDAQPRRAAEGFCAKTTRLPARAAGALHYPLHTSVLEGIHNKIKVIKRMAYGCRGEQYFFRKIRAAFPGIGRRAKKKAASIDFSAGGPMLNPVEQSFDGGIRIQNSNATPPTRAVLCGLVQ